MSHTLQVCSICLLLNVQVEAHVIKFLTLIFIFYTQETLAKKYQVVHVTCIILYSL